MNTKRIIALFAAILMLICLFSACAGNTGKTDDSASSSKVDAKTDTKKDDAKKDDKMDDGKKDNGKTDTPVEDELETISFLARSNGENYNTWKEKEGANANLMQCVENQHKYGFEVETSFAAAEVYTTTVTSLGASGNLPQVYGTYGAIDSTTLVDWTNRGMFVPCSSVLAESSGNMVKAFGDDGLYKWARAKAAHTDGDWYIVMITNDPARYLKITEEDGPCRVGVQLHGIYGLMTRQDWLDKLGLTMPQNPDEYYEACLKMHEEDINGNGQKDERIIVGLGSAYQQQGIGQWYGLPYQDFFSDPSNGKVEVGMLYPGYADWATYLNKFYSHQLVYNNEGGHPWVEVSNYIAKNNVISWYCQANAIWSNGRTNSGDDNCNYQPMPIIAAVDGVKARIICQEATAAEWGISYNAANCSPKTAAKFTDCVYSYEQWLVRYYGIEGKGWEYESDGVHIHDFTQDPGYTKGDIEDQYLANMDKSWIEFLGYFPIPFFKDLWDPTHVIYQSAQEAVDVGEPYAENATTREIWMTNNKVDYDQPNWVQLNNVAKYGEKNINVACYYDFETLPTAEEAEIQGDLSSDLKTYVQEVGTKLIIGDYDVSKLQEYIDYAYENLSLQKYIDIQQTRVDRFMEAMGLKK